MSYQNEAILRDKNGDPIPQYYDTKLKRYEPLTEKFSDDVEVSNFPGDFNVNNLPEDYPDEAVKTELEAIKGTQSEIISALQSTNEVLNSVIKDDRLQSDTQLTGSNVEDAFPVKTLKETYSENFIKLITDGTTELVAEYPFPCELTSFSMGTNGRQTSVRIENKANGNYDSGIRIVLPKGISTNPVAPNTLHLINGENDFWREFVYDTEVNEYAFGMKRVAIFSKGLRIRVSAREDCNVALTYMVTRLEG